jgi:hypothetical protein
MSFAGSYYNGDQQPYSQPGAWYDYHASGGMPAQVTPSAPTTKKP